MYDPSKVKNPYITLTEQMERLLTTKQEDDETITEYVKHFKQARDNFKELIGDTFLHDFVKTTVEYKNEADTGKKTELAKNSTETWMSYLVLRNSDSNKYGSLKRNFRTQYALNNDQYPRKINNMTDVLNSHQWDATYNENKKKRKEEKEKSRQDSRSNSLSQSDEKTEENSGTQHAQVKNIDCYCCGEKGHYASKCPLRDKIPKEKWAMKKGIQMVQDLNTEATEKAENEKSVNKT